MLAIGLLVTLAAWRLAPPLAAPVAAVTNCTTSRAGNNDSEELKMLSLINAYRAQNGEASLIPSAALGQSALWKSTDMAANHYFSHDDLSRGWSQRIHDCGYASGYAGENLAAGNADAQDTLQQWETSPEHNANLLNASYHAIGVGRAASASGYWYWTADFGDTADAGAPATPPLPPPGPPPPPSPSHTAGVVAAAGDLAAGQIAVVNTPNDCLHARAAASVSAPVLTCVPDGTSVLLVDGPVTADGYTWWEAFGAGWVAGAYLRRPG
jgi:uncharacterized protein YkwD